MHRFLLVNFGGPRNREEIAPFLCELLCDRDVIRSSLPRFLHQWVFRRAAKKRSLKIQHDYALIGGRSPIFFDTETLGKKLDALTFHRYLPATHQESLQKIEECNEEEIRVVPLFPQFSFTTTGSIARFFLRNLSKKTLRKLRWVHSYAIHPGFVEAYQRRIREFLKQNNLCENQCAFLFSAHGLPRSYIEEGDIYEQECERSYKRVALAFREAVHRLSFQSKFGPGEWLRPYTDESCEEVHTWCQGREKIVIIPISFTSDHIETLFEIEHIYLPILRAKGKESYRCPSLNLEEYWIESIQHIGESSPLCSTQMLIRHYRADALKI